MSFFTEFAHPLSWESKYEYSKIELASSESAVCWEMSFSLQKTSKFAAFLVFLFRNTVYSR